MHHPVKNGTTVKNKAGREVGLALPGPSFSFVYFRFLSFFSFSFYFMFFHFLPFSSIYFHFLFSFFFFFFVGCSKSVFFWVSISLRFLLTSSYAKSQFWGPSRGYRFGPSFPFFFLLFFLVLFVFFCSV